MRSRIPTFDITQIKGNSVSANEVFFADNAAKTIYNRVNIPYRSSYYGLAVCVAGQATLVANLEKYDIKKDSVIAMSPQVIKNWLGFSDDFNTMTLFFTKNFTTKFFGDQNYLDQFSFFDVNTKHVLEYDQNENWILRDLMKTIQSKLTEQNPFKYEIVSSYTNVLLFEYQNMFSKLSFKHNLHLSRGEQLTLDFKLLLNNHFQKEHGVKFYADSLFVTPKHLTETIKKTTGRTSGEWIDDFLVLEAKILLANNQLQILQIAEQLHFPDASTFGKFFKNLAGVSPLAYRQSL